MVLTGPAAPVLCGHESKERRSAHRCATDGRFIPDDLLPLFERETAGTLEAPETLRNPSASFRMDIAAILREMRG